MNKTTHPPRAEPSPETQPIGPPGPFRATQETEFERLKNRLLTETLLISGHPDLNAPIRRAANDAAALAWATVHPILVFPILFEEMLRKAVRHADRQARIFTNTRKFAEAE